MQSKRRKFRVNLSITFFLILFLTAGVWAANLSVHVLDVGNGDSTLIVSPTGVTVLVDAGPKKRGEDVVLPYLQTLGITQLDYIVASHYEADHIGGVDEVITGLGGISNILSAVYDRGGTYGDNTIAYQEYAAATLSKRTTIVPGTVIDLGGGAALTCIAANGEIEGQVIYGGTANENNLSVVLRLDYYDFQMCLGGDIEKTMETGVAALVGDVDVYKVHHHGSYTSSTEDLLDEARPEIATLSVGNNSFRPAQETFDRLAAVGSYIYQTETGRAAPAPGFGEVVGGNFTITSGGCSYTVSRSNQTLATYYTDSSHHIDCPPEDEPELELDRTAFFFGAAGGTATGAQDLGIRNAGTGTLYWTVSETASWLSVDNTSGSGDRRVSLTVDGSGLAAGTYTAALTVDAVDAANSPQTVSVQLTVYITDAPPFGSFETPTGENTVFSSVPVTGWVLDDVEIAGVGIYRDPVDGEGSGRVYIGDAILVEGARPDIAAAYPEYPMNHKAGWGYMLLTNALPGGGNGSYVLYAVAADVTGHQITLGSRAIVCDNLNAVKPFGAIDAPAPGAVVSGGAYRNSGWVLTPMPNKIPEDGSTIFVYVDGVNTGQADYNVYRQDIAEFFPGYANSDGALAYFDIDTTALSDGLHTIAWSVTDDAENADGIGSRYFKVQNIGIRGKGSGVRRSLELRGKRSGVMKNFGPVRAMRGYDQTNKLMEIHPDENGVITVEIEELQRLELHLPPDPSLPLTPDPLPLKNATQGYRGYLLTDSGLQPLPVGSTLDPGGVFTWQPGPGFVGNYELVFTENRSGQRSTTRIRIQVAPKF